MNNQSMGEFNNLTMLDIFCTELKTAVQTIETGLTNIESDHSPEKIEPLMRAAHSIRGAARIVGLDIIVIFAHSIEEAFNYALSGNVNITPDILDILLKCNKIFMELSDLKTTDIPYHLEKNKKKIESLGDQLQNMIALQISHITVKEPIPAESKQHAASSPFNEISDRSIFELFLIEVENHSRVIEEVLVEIEKEQTPEKIEPLMRAAHSIKGAARIVGLNLEVSLAHTMEDVFSRAQRGDLKLTSKHIDLLLHSNDFFRKLAALKINDISNWLVEQSDNIKALTQALIDILAGKPARIPQNRVETQKKLSQDQQDLTSKDDSLVRVLAENLNRIMGLAGECLVQARFSKPFSSSLLQMKINCMELNSIMESILLSPEAEMIPEGLYIKINDSHKKINHIHDLLMEHIVDYEHFSQRLEYFSEHLYNEIINSRMRPFSDGLHGFQRMVRDLAQKMRKEVEFKVLKGSTRVDSDILEKLKAPLTHLIHNAIDHGLETPEERINAGKPAKGRLVFEARHMYGMLNITVSDDGRGIDPEIIRQKVSKTGQVSKDIAENLSDLELFDFLFLPTFSTAGKVSEISGRGVGLDVVSSMVHEVGGSVHIESNIGEGTTFHLRLPLTLSVLRTLLVEINNEPYALPLTRIEHVIEIEQQDLHILEDRQFCTLENEHIGIIHARQIMRIPDSQSDSGRLCIAIIKDRLTQYGIVVDRFLGERELVVRPLDPRLGKIPNISAGSIMEDGSPVLIMDVDDLVRSIDNILSNARPDKMLGKKTQLHLTKKRVLVVDDSLTVRQVERKLLENRGYEVVAAVDGMDGWITLQSNIFDLIISDVDMPRLNGIELVRKIKNDPKLKDIPVMIISYKDQEEDKLRGLEAGANYYLTKASFHDETLIDAIRDLIGDP
ncbi:MAG: hybrid sensor histidine kinase/response regulator [Candidatus Latescibacteria bacterium]|nr:hybrid sensor histidine kinase/response regulator [Candidatus Latescibacterota bacterium]